MLLMGDEVRRTQRGNNNAYCQDNEISWFDWGLAARHADIHRFVKRLIAFRLNRELPIGGLDMTLNELLAGNRFNGTGSGSTLPIGAMIPTCCLRRSPAGRPVRAPPHGERLLGAARV